MMIQLNEPTTEQRTGWNEWVAGRPDCVRVVAERFNPWTLYRMKNTGQRVTLYSFNEDGTMTVSVTGEFNLIEFDRVVFGINPDNLEECDLPADGEIVGEVLDEAQQVEYINARRKQNGLPPMDQAA